MKKYTRYNITAILLFLCFITLIFFTTNIKGENQPAADKNPKVIVEFFYLDGCSACEQKKPIIDNIEQYYGNNISVLRLLYNENREEFLAYGFKTVPSAVVKNLSSGLYTMFTYERITEENLKDSIDRHLAGNYSTPPTQKTDTIIETPFGKINLSELSLPVITIVLAAADSFNPCSFFMLLFLLSLIIHMQLRKRILLVGGIFVFFSGLFYFLMMAAILNIILILENQTIITIIAGILALIFAVLNIKDFFFFKKGPSLSIPDSKKPKLFKKVRDIAKMSYLPGIIGYTILLAISVNTVELLCTLSLPMVFAGILTSYGLSTFQYYCYILFYNIIYVLPLIIIVVAFATILGHWKLTEWQGRTLKLYSGILMLSLGLILIIKPDLLHNIFSAIILILISIGITALIYFIWKNSAEKTNI